MDPESQEVQLNEDVKKLRYVGQGLGVLGALLTLVGFFIKESAYVYIGLLTFGVAMLLLLVDAYTKSQNIAK
jgi:hypothetical protein